MTLGAGFRACGAGPEGLCQWAAGAADVPNGRSPTRPGARLCHDGDGIGGQVTVTPRRARGVAAAPGLTISNLKVGVRNLRNFLALA